ncbi:MAG TPA: hypothetical protein DCW68_00140 [Rhodospirillaceae bacterium]|nr:MAG: hypothetical protein A2018_01455 [Alphaproteobacteria bacterium GWF2_58_20]HAU28509.1 hypothetical protein [Rhodospirillaceae bacterium]
MGFAGMQVSAPRRKSCSARTEERRNHEGAGLSPDRVVSFEAVTGQLSRASWGETLAGGEFMTRFRQHLCRQVRMQFGKAWFFNRHSPAWVHERAERDAVRGPQGCFFTAEDLMAAVRAVGAAPAMEQDMAQAILRARDCAPDVVSGALRPTRDLVGSYFHPAYRPAPK